jgi:methyl-accepting chemotaxis protein
MSDFVDKSGKLKNFDVLIKKIGKAGITPTKIMQAFGKRGGRAILDLTAKGKDLKEFTKDLENAEGAAKNMADVMQRGLPGAFFRLKSTFEAFQLSITEGGVGETLEEMIRALADFLEMAAETSVLDALEESFADFGSNLGEWAKDSDSAFGVFIIGLQTFLDTTEEVLDGLESKVGGTFTSIVDTVVGFHDSVNNLSFSGFVESVTAGFENITATAKNLIEAIQAIFTTFSALTGGDFVTEIENSAKEALGGISDSVANALKAIPGGKAFFPEAEGGKEVFGAGSEVLGKLLTGAKSETKVVIDVRGKDGATAVVGEPPKKKGKPNVKISTINAGQVSGAPPIP